MAQYLYPVLLLLGSNIFIVREGQLFTPSERYVLPGVSRQMTMDMAKRIGARVTEVKASHAVFMTQPKVVADVIDQAAHHAAHAKR